MVKWEYCRLNADGFTTTFIRGGMVTGFSGQEERKSRAYVWKLSNVLSTEYPAISVEEVAEVEAMKGFGNDYSLQKEKLMDLMIGYLGENGWELVNAVSRDYGNITGYVFRRHISN